MTGSDPARLGFAATPAVAASDTSAEPAVGQTGAGRRTLAAAASLSGIRLLDAALCSGAEEYRCGSRWRACSGRSARAGNWPPSVAARTVANPATRVRRAPRRTATLTRIPPPPGCGRPDRSILISALQEREVAAPALRTGPETRVSRLRRTPPGPLRRSARPAIPGHGRCHR